MLGIYFAYELLILAKNFGEEVRWRYRRVGGHICCENYHVSDGQDLNGENKEAQEES